MHTCPPVNERALNPRFSSAIAVSAIVTCSPVASSTSSSRGLGRGAMLVPRPSNRSVSPDIAETTTTMSSPARRAAQTLSATCSMRAQSATEVPPYFEQSAPWQLVADAGLDQCHGVIPAKAGIRENKIPVPPLPRG